jgi:hypothetical protein
MGNYGARLFGMTQAPLSIEDCVSAMEIFINTVDKNTHGGRMWSYDGKEETWETLVFLLTTSLPWVTEYKAYGGTPTKWQADQARGDLY